MNANAPAKAHTTTDPANGVSRMKLHSSDQKPARQALAPVTGTQPVPAPAIKSKPAAPAQSYLDTLAEQAEASRSEVDDAEEQEEDEEEADDLDDWLRMTPVSNAQAVDALERINATFAEELDMEDSTMVAEYADDILEYMADLEIATLPNPTYMSHQTEINWTMRATLVDWLLQVHLRYHLLPETLWIAVNILDRFLTVRVVSMVKLQLVGVTAMFIAAKYEEILAPSVEEFVFMTENGFSKDEVLKGERIMLSTLNFDISSYCSPLTWVRRISKADDYDLQTRTLCKFLIEVTLLDHRFIRAKPSMIAAVGMCVSRRMLGGDWNDTFMYYSGYTESQLEVACNFLVDQIADSDFESQFIYRKYASKRYLRASTFARTWALQHTGGGAA